MDPNPWPCCTGGDTVSYMGHKRPKGVWNKAFADEVVRQRHTAKLTQKDIVQRSGIPSSTYSKFEIDQTVVTLDQIADIAQAIGTTVESLAQGAGLRVEAINVLDLTEDDLRAMPAAAIARLLDVARVAGPNGDFTGELVTSEGSFTGPVSDEDAAMLQRTFARERSDRES